MKIKYLLFCIGLFISMRLAAQNVQLWGTAEYGGAYNGGTIFSMNTDGTNFNVERAFNTLPGNHPRGNLFMASDSNLYGVCAGGEWYGGGTIYRYNPVNGDYSDVYSFDWTHGNFPASGVVEKDGVLYGTAVIGGVNGRGVIYSYTIATEIYTDLYDMAYPAEANPYSTPVVASDGKLYGTTANASGTIYSFDPATNIYSTVHEFDFLTAYLPVGGLIQASDGKLYGMARDGGANSSGAIFSFDPLDNIYESLYDFDFSTGGFPSGTLMQGSNGILYGLTTEGGSNYHGVIFSFDPSGNTYTKLFDLSDSVGILPLANLMQVGNILYGTTFHGSANDDGTVFNFDLLTNTFTKLLDFNGSNGAYPTGGFITLSGIESGVQLPPVDVFTINPNPVTQYVICNATSFNNQKVNLIVTDLSGKEILSQQLVMRNSQLKINLGNLTSGVYFIELMADNEKKIAKVMKE